MRPRLAATSLLLLALLLLGCAEPTPPAAVRLAGGLALATPPPPTDTAVATGGRAEAMSERGGRPASVVSPTATPLPTLSPTRQATAIARTTPGNPARQPSPSATAVTLATPTPTTKPSISGNWSGYKALGGDFTAVAGTWKVPPVRSVGNNSSSSVWVGIGGAGSPDLIQAGTQGYFDAAGTVHYEAWTETLPEAMSRVPLSVKPGDLVTVVIARAATDKWSIDMRNGTTGEAYQTTAHYQSSHSSAEWIVEAPCVNGRTLALADFGSLQFSALSAVKAGRVLSIAETGAEPILLAAEGRVVASPTGVSPDGSGFRVDRLRVP
jgi:hypothetical protein